MSTAKVKKTMSNLEKFGLITSIIGLVADLITLVGIASVLSIPSPDLGLGGRSEIISIWTFSLMVYGLVVCLVFVFQYAQNRWLSLGETPTKEYQSKATIALGYLFWLPISIIWGIVMVQLFMPTYQISTSDSNASVLPALGWLYFVFVVPLGGFVITRTSVFLKAYFNPTILDRQEKE